MNEPADLSALPAGARVVAAMSGGVDSAVAAALLAEAGFDVVGITLQLYDSGAATARGRTCCAGQDVRDARRAADAIGVPHYVLDYEERFRRDVVEPFAESYLAGETPVPCIACNRTVKFRDLMAVARELGAAALATGHYVRRVEGRAGPELHRAADAGKDQSYFLFATTAEQLAFLRFPLGAMRKEAVRAHARRLGLTLAEKPESQDICFVPGRDYREVVRRLRPEAHEPGEIVDLSGRVVGRHEGVAGFTVGQRRGLGLGDGSGADAAPLYVLRIDAAACRVVVGPHAALGRAELRLRDLNWLGGAAPAEGLAVGARIRSTRPPGPARLYDGGARVVLDEAERAVAPGQACVLYDGSRVLGGGWIAREERAAA